MGGWGSDDLYRFDGWEVWYMTPRRRRLAWRLTRRAPRPSRRRWPWSGTTQGRTSSEPRRGHNGHAQRSLDVRRRSRPFGAIPLSIPICERKRTGANPCLNFASWGSPGVIFGPPDVITEDSTGDST